MIITDVYVFVIFYVNVCRSCAWNIHLFSLHRGLFVSAAISAVTCRTSASQYHSVSLIRSPVNSCVRAVCSCQFKQGNVRSESITETENSVKYL